MSTTEVAAPSEPSLETIVASLRVVEPAAFAVAPRVLRRVLRSEFELRTLWTRVPHRRSFVIARDRLSGLVAADELGIDDLAHLPDRVILLAMPEDAERAKMTVSGMAEWFHRLLFHARIHVAYDNLLRSGRLTQAGIRARIDRVGQGAFDEARLVLAEEHWILRDTPLPSAFIEFGAVWVELERFAPQLLAKWFPSLTDRERIGRLLAEDVDSASLFDATRIPGGVVSAEEDGDDDEDRVAPPPLPRPWFWQRWFSRRVYRTRTRAARAVGNRGNDVRSAILWKTAEPFAQDDERPSIEVEVQQCVARLTQRLGAALEFGPEQAGEWEDVLRGLVANSARGFWNTDARLLFDLQKVCLDHERQISAVDLVGWATSLGRHPIRRSLPNQREVLMSKHLHSAARRIPRVTLTGTLRRKLSHLLESAAASAEQQLRRRLKPLITEALTEVGMTPADVPERVAFRKIIDELNDGVVRQGYLSMGDLRDSISRNQLKLHDLGGFREVLSGDELLRADRTLDDKLDGVYRRGEFYLRWLQRASSLAFGTALGRKFVLFFAIPFGGAYVTMEGLNHLLLMLFPSDQRPKFNFLPATRHLIAAVSEGISEKNALGIGVLTLVVLGAILLLVVHWKAFRAFLASVFTSCYHVLRGLTWDFPQWLLKLEIVRAILRHPLTTAMRRWIVQPAALTGLVWGLLPWLGVPNRPGWIGTAPIFVLIAMILNSRTGRDIEEVATEQIEKTWHLIRIRIFVALFDAVMESFKKILDVIEKLLYEVDEFLRFRSGEGIVTLVVKGVLGVVWGVVTFVVRIYVTLLIEPQVNPIKHFPVVTVSHKVILPFTLVLTKLFAAPLEPFLGKVTANTIAGATVLLLPGIFGFLVWESRENWRLYAANRLPRLHPTHVGEGGETVSRLLKPGFHSGVLPKLHSRRRRAAQHSDPRRRREGELKFQHRLRGLHQAVERFAHRELVVLLEESGTVAPGHVRVSAVESGVNMLRISFECPSLSLDAAQIVLLEQSGWVVAAIDRPGWLECLSPAQRERVEAALSGFYVLSSVDLVREQIDSCLGPRFGPYDVSDRDLVYWPGRNFDSEVRYHLTERPVLRPRPRHLAETYLFPRIESRPLIFADQIITWDEWRHCWNGAETSPDAPVQPPLRGIPLLPAPGTAT